ncbi:MAG: tetratricopeptide repeat protein [Candidatus Omnitrophica bacterium]|nr:tetratricopeptide repeat protein [Candidatus Omnitrophota bacterium]
MVNEKNTNILTNDTPKEIKDLFDKGVSAFNRKNYEYAIELFSQILRLKFDFAEARHYLRLAEQKFFKEHPPKLLSRILNRFYCFFYGLRASIFYLQNNIKRSVDEYEKLLRKEPFDEKALLKLARIFQKINDANSALRLFEEVVQLKPKNIEALKRLGELYIKTDDLPRARSCFNAVLSISPYDLDAEKFLRNLDALGTLKKNFHQ